MEWKNAEFSICTDSNINKLIIQDKEKKEKKEFQINTEYVDDEILEYNGGESKDTQDILENDARKKAALKEKIDKLTDGIRQIEDINGKVEEINNANVGDAGTIIFWNSDNKSITVNCADITNKIDEILNMTELEL